MNPFYRFQLFVILTTLALLPLSIKADDTTPVYIMKMTAAGQVSSNIVGRLEVPVWREDVAQTFYSPWVEVGGLYDCTPLTPPANTVDLGVSFQQSKTCSQVESRTVTTQLVSSKPGISRPSETVTEERVLIVNLTNGAVGTNGEVKPVGERVGEWVVLNTNNSCSSSPSEFSVSLGEVFTQTTVCTTVTNFQRDIYQIMSDGQENFLRSESKSESESESTSQDATGKMDYIVSSGTTSSVSPFYGCTGGGKYRIITRSNFDEYASGNRVVTSVVETVQKTSTCTRDPRFN